MQRWSSSFLVGSLVVATWLGGTASGCASNPTRRCGVDSDCLEQDRCYRGFCIAPSPRDAGSSDANRACPLGQTACDARCFDLLRDRNHCGRCEVMCPGGPHASCVAGRCATD